MPALRGAPAGPRPRAYGLRARAGLRGLPHFTQGPRPRIPAAYACHAGGRRTAAIAAGGISSARAEIVWLDLGRGFWLGRNRRLRSVHDLHRACAGAAGGGWFWWN